MKIIEDEIREFTYGNADLDPKDCTHVQNRIKIAILNVNVIVYFGGKKDQLEFVSGMEFMLRVSCFFIF